MKTTKESVFEFIQQEIYTNHHQDGMETKEVAEAMHMQRSNVSTLLNELVKDGKLVKTNTRPVFYKLPDSVNRNSEDASFIELIGHNGSLKKAIQLAKAAILYPRKSLNVLLSIQPGSGTTFFAYKMYEFAKERQVLKEDAPYVKINSHHYSKNVSTLNDDLFGDNGNLDNSCFARAKGGMLFIEHFDLLNAKQQSRILTLLETGMLTSDDNVHTLDCHDIILILSCSAQNSMELSGRIPIMIELPKLSERPIEERFQLINHFFSVEAAHSDRSIEVSSETIKALLMSDFDYNVKELQMEIKTICANAYVRVVDDYEKNIYVCLNDLKQNIKRNLLAQKDHAQELDELLGIDEYVFYDKNTGYQEDNKAIENMYSSIKTQFDELSNRGVNASSIVNVINNHIQQLFNTYNYQNRYDDTRNLEQLSKIVDKRVINIVSIFLEACQKDLKREFKTSVFYGLCLHINSLYTHTPTHQRVSDEQIILTVQNFPKEYAASIQFANVLKDELKLNLTTDEIILIAMFLTETEENTDSYPVLLYIFHGRGTAKSLMEVTNALTQCQNAYSFDMDLEMNTQKAMEEIKALILKIDNGTGVLVIYDMGSIKTILDTISEELEVKIRYIQLPITQIGIDAARICNCESDLDDAYHHVMEDINKMQKKENVPNAAIITLCHTGEGGAVQLKDYIDKYSRMNMKTIALSISDRYQLIKEVLEIKKIYEIHAFVGTYDPKLFGIPFISISKIFENRKEDIDHILMFEPISSKQLDYNQIYKHLEKQMKFVSINKLRKVLPSIIDEFSVVYSLDEEQALGLFMHITSLLERLLSQEGSIKNANTKQILSAYDEDYQYIFKKMKLLEKTFKVIIDDNEIATMIMIVRNIQG